MTTLFVSDLHLDPARPEITDLFLRFLETEARGAQALYILGDLFEAWVGDDDPSPAGAAVADALHALADHGVAIGFMHGNRDFLLGEDYARRARMALLHDPAVVEVEGRQVLLSHGDLFCTDDTDYQRFRTQTRDPAWQQAFLAQPLPARLAFAQQARAASQTRAGELRADGRMETITDVAPATVAAAFDAHGVDTIIHGHTHRPDVHHVPAPGGGMRRRIVLGDWYEQGSVLRVDGDRYTLSSLPVASAG